MVECRCSSVLPIDLERLRGRTTYAAVVQAADYLLRKQLGELRLDALSFDGLKPLEGGQRVR